MLLDRNKLAEAFQVSPSTVSTWRKKGLPHTKKGKRIFYDLSESLKWVVQHETAKLLKNHQLGGKVLSEKEAKAREATFRAALMELKLHEERENLVRVEKVASYVDSLTNQLKSAVMGIPGAWSDRIIGIKDRTEALEKLDGLSRKLLEDLANQKLEIEEGEENDA